MILGEAHVLPAAADRPSCSSGRRRWWCAGSECQGGSRPGGWTLGGNKGDLQLLGPLPGSVHRSPPHQSLLQRDVQNGNSWCHCHLTACKLSCIYCYLRLESTGKTSSSTLKISERQFDYGSSWKWTLKKGSSLCLTSACTPSSVSSPLAGPQMLQYHHNVEQSLEFPVVSDIWLKVKTHFRSFEWATSVLTCTSTDMFAPAMLPKFSWRMDKTFHTVAEKAWGLSKRREQPLWQHETRRIKWCTCGTTLQVTYLTQRLHCIICCIQNSIGVALPYKSPTQCTAEPSLVDYESPECH